LCLNYITYDPNYNYETDDGDTGNAMDTEDDEYVDSEEYSDDDDMSWKVRRAAAKCLEVLISTRQELIEDFYRSLSNFIYIIVLAYICIYLIKFEISRIGPKLRNCSLISYSTNPFKYVFVN